MGSKTLHEFAMQRLPFNIIINVNHIAHIQQRLLHMTKYTILLLTDKYDTSALYVSLAYQFRDKFIFGESRAKNLALAKQFAVKKYPFLLAFFPNYKLSKTSSSIRIKYDGP